MVTGSDLRSREREVDSITRPDPRQHAEQILLWVLCWPWNLLWTALVHNPVRHIVQFLIVELRATLEEISSGEFQEIERDLVIGEPLPEANRVQESTDDDTVAMEPGDTVMAAAPVLKAAIRTPEPRPAELPPAAAVAAQSRLPNSAPVYTPPPEPAHLAAQSTEDPWFGSGKSEGEDKDAWSDAK